MQKFWLGVFLIVFFSFALSAYFYPLLPEQIPTRWNEAGQITGYMAKEAALLLMPGISLLLAALFFFIPKIDPLKKNYSAFMPQFKDFIIIMLFFMLYLHSLLISAGIGFNIQMNYWLMPAMAVLFLYVSLLLKKAKRNWFVGIRTPWTLSSDKVWEKTHKMGSWLFALFALMFLAAGFFPVLLLPAVLLILFLSAGLFAYSYYEYSKEKKGK